MPTDHDARITANADDLDDLRLQIGTLRRAVHALDQHVNVLASSIALTCRQQMRDRAELEAELDWT